MIQAISSLYGDRKSTPGSLGSSAGVYQSQSQPQSPKSCTKLQSSSNSSTIVPQTRGLPKSHAIHIVTYIKGKVEWEHIRMPHAKFVWL